MIPRAQAFILLHELGHLLHAEGFQDGYNNSAAARSAESPPLRLCGFLTFNNWFLINARTRTWHTEKPQSPDTRDSALPAPNSSW
jgi:hypothetical protein